MLYVTDAHERYEPGTPEAEESRLVYELTRVGWGGTVPAFRQLFSSMFIASAGEEQKRWYDDMHKVSSTGEMAARLWLSRSDFDISETARGVTQPALVLHAPARTRPSPVSPRVAVLAALAEHDVKRRIGEGQREHAAIMPR